MYNVGDFAYIEYRKKLVGVKILEVHGNYYIVETKGHEILGIPPESYTKLWRSKEEYDKYKLLESLSFIPQGGIV